MMMDTPSPDFFISMSTLPLLRSMTSTALLRILTTADLKSMFSTVFLYEFGKMARLQGEITVMVTVFYPRLFDGGFDDGVQVDRV